MSGPNITALRRLAGGQPAHEELEEDEIEMPGGGQRSIDDLEASYGRAPEALMRKARPEVYAAEHEGMSPAQVDQLARTRRMPAPERDWMAGAPSATIDEDEVELPGGGQASFDALESIGGLTPALEAKARPDVIVARREMGETGRARDRFAQMLEATQPRVDTRRRENADEMQVARIIREEMPDAEPSMIAEYLRWYRTNPRQFEREFYDFAADRREAMARRQASVDTARQVEAARPSTTTVTRMGR